MTYQIPVMHDRNKECRVGGIILTHRGQRRLSRKGVYWSLVLNDRTFCTVVGSTAIHGLPEP